MGRMCDSGVDFSIRRLTFIKFSPSSPILKGNGGEGGGVVHCAGHSDRNKGEKYEAQHASVSEGGLHAQLSSALSPQLTSQ